MAKKLTYDELKQRMRKLEKESVDYKQSAKQILLANERLQYLLSSTSAVIYTAKTSDDYGTIFINDNVAQMVGYEPKEFLKDSSFGSIMFIPKTYPEFQRRSLRYLKKNFTPINTASSIKTANIFRYVTRYNWFGIVMESH